MRYLLLLLLVTSTSVSVCAQSAARLGHASTDSLMAAGEMRARIVVSGSVTGLRTSESTAWFGFLPLGGFTPASVFEEALSLQLHATPTPATDVLRITLPTVLQSQSTRWRLLDVKGLEVLRSDALITNDFTIDVTALATGTYSLVVECRGLRAFARVVVLH
ncbi:MAG: hypothetical protein SGJ05_02670 [bacterium]|nr:hypothetical protein [bacterium]